MKEQEKRFILLDPVVGWRKSQRTEPPYKFHEDYSGLSLQKALGTGKPLADEKGTFGGFDYPTGLVVDRDANIYISDTNNHRIRKFDTCTKQFTTLPCLGGKGNQPRQLKEPRGLAISKSNDLLVADTGNHRIQVFTIKGWVLRRWWGAKDPRGNPIEGSEDGQFNLPTDIAVDSRDYVYVVDNGNKRIQKFSIEGEHLLTFGQEGSGDGQFLSPTHIAVDGKDRLYIVDDVKNDVQVFDRNGTYIGKIEWTHEAGESFKPLAITIDKEGNVYIADGVGKRLYKFLLKQETGNQVTLVNIVGWSSGFAVAGTVSYLVISEGNLYAALKHMGIVAVGPEKTVYENEDHFISEPLDSAIYKCQWHRILMEADIPDGTSIYIQTYSSESKKDILEIKNLYDTLWSDPQVNAPDFLVLSPPARYLWLKVTIKSNIKETPLLKSLRVHFPRQSSLQYLPKVFQEDETSRLFLERFLSIFDTQLSGFNEVIDRMARYFDPMAVPADFLPWLGSWLALLLDEEWPQHKKRELIARAPELYKMRGTPRGLMEYIKILTGVSSHISIIEHYKLRQWIFLGHSTLGCESAVWGKGIVQRLQLDEYSSICSFRLISTGDPLMDPFHQHAHRFSVVLPSHFCEGKAKERTIRRIVEAEKPTHTQYTLCKVEPKFSVGVQSTIGVDSIIAEYPVMILGLKASLGIDSVLGESQRQRGAPTMKIGDTSHIGVDTLVN